MLILSTKAGAVDICTKTLGDNGFSIKITLRYKADELDSIKDEQRWKSGDKYLLGTEEFTPIHLISISRPLGWQIDGAENSRTYAYTMGTNSHTRYAKLLRVYPHHEFVEIIQFTANGSDYLKLSCVTTEPSAN